MLRDIVKSLISGVHLTILTMNLRQSNFMKVPIERNFKDSRHFVTRFRWAVSRGIATIV